MKCPNCNRIAKVPEVALINTDTYDRTVKVRVSCCNKIVFLSPVRSYRLDLYREKDGEKDDWGE
jgi:iron only hydrogenase large subunit-like protein